MSGTNGAFARALVLCASGQFTPRASAEVRLGAAEPANRVATTDAHRRAISRLVTSNLREEDRLPIDELLDRLEGRERRVFAQAIKLAGGWSPNEDTRVAPDPAIERALAEMYAEQAAAALVDQQKKDLMLIAGESLRRAKNPAEVSARLEPLREAEEVYRQVHDQVEHVISRITDLLRKRDARKRDAVLEQTIKR